jgi:sterol desaturase/sphingolipid hydroxylase (fatty acid hydroxylase superfamily)
VSLASLGSALATVCIFAAIFTPLERLLPRRREAWRRRALGTDVLVLLGNFLVWTPLVNLLLTPAMSAAASISPATLLPAELPLGWRLLLAWLTVDLCTYWFHRLSHQLPWLWRLHRVHHTAEHLDWVAAYREHPLDNLLTRAVENLPLLLFGLPLPLVAGFAAFRGLYALYIHSNIRLEPGVLRYVLGSPRLHHFHHDCERGGACNYANLNPLFDLLFGTYHDPGSAEPRLGDPERSAPTYLGLLWEPVEHALTNASSRLASASSRADKRPDRAHKSQPCAR